MGVAKKIADKVAYEKESWRMSKAELQRLKAEDQAKKGGKR